MNGTRMLKFGSLVTLALVAGTLAGTAQAQIRTRGPIIANPPQGNIPIRNRVPSPTPTPTASDCPDPIAARRAGRAVPAGCPGATEEQAPVRVDTAEASGERPDRGRRVGGTPVRNYPQGRDPVVATPPSEGRIRVGRVPAEDRAADAPAPDTRRARVMPDNGETEIRPTPVRDRGGRVTRNDPPAENSGYEDRRQDSGGITRVMPTPDDPRMRYSPDRRVGREPDEETPTEAAPRPRPWDRRGGDPVATTPDTDRAPVRRVPQPRYSDAGDATPTPVRPVRPVTGGGTIPTLADRGISSQIECVVFHPERTLATNIDFNAMMLCGFPGRGKFMNFRVKPAQWYVIQGAYAQGFSVRVSYGEPVNGVYPVVAVSEGRFTRHKAVCVPVYARYISNTNLVVGKQNEQSNAYRMWCTEDGKVVAPLTMGWVPPSDYPTLRDSVVEDGPLEVTYFDISTPFTLEDARQLDPYPGPGTNWSDTTAIADRNKVNTQGLPSSGYRFTYAEAPLTGRVYRCVGEPQEIAAGICRGYWRTDTVSPVWKQYKAYATSNIRSAAMRPAEDGKEVKDVYFTLMPGIIPVQYRAEAGGACRVILGVEVVIDYKPGYVGVSYPDGDPRNPKTARSGGQGVGVPSAPYVPAKPLIDTCQN